MFIDSAFNTLNKPGTGDIFIKDSIKQNKYAVVKHDYAKAIACLDSMIILVKDKTGEEKYAERYAAVLYEKGQWFLEMKRYKESFQYISMAENAIKLVKYKCKIADYIFKIAYLMFAQEKYHESAFYFSKILQNASIGLQQDSIEQKNRKFDELNLDREF